MQDVITFVHITYLGWKGLLRSEFLVIVSSTSCCWTEYVVHYDVVKHCDCYKNHLLITIRTRITVCSASFPLLLLELDIPKRGRSWYTDLTVSRCRTSQFARCFLPVHAGSNVEWPSQYCVWRRNAGWVQGCCQQLVASLSSVFFSFPWPRCLYGVVKAITNKFFHFFFSCCLF